MTIIVYDRDEGTQLQRPCYTITSVERKHRFATNERCLMHDIEQNVDKFKLQSAIITWSRQKPKLYSR